MVKLFLERALSSEELFDFLENRYRRYHQVSFIESDPICIPHLFSKKEDVEIMGFLMATIAWGQRKTIIENGRKLVQIFHENPFEFIMNASSVDLLNLRHFKHRTFQFEDAQYFVLALRNIYQHEGGLENAFLHHDPYQRLLKFRSVFFSLQHPQRTQKHISNPAKGFS